MNKAIGVIGVLFLVVLICLLVSESKRKKLVQTLNTHPEGILTFGLLLFCYISFLAILTGSFGKYSKSLQALYFLIPGLVAFLHSGKSNFIVLFVVLALWLPVETRLMLKNLEVGGARYPYVAASAVLIGLSLLAWKSPSDISLAWSFKKSDLAMCGKMYLLLAAVMIPATLAIGFINPGINPAAQKYPYGIPLVMIAFWFFPALAEEIIFRAGIQNVFSDWLGKWGGLAFASLVFGLAHINNKVVAGGQKFGFPNWHYVVFASVAGFAYGFLYLRLKERGSRNALGVTAILHAGVDFTWWLIFKG